MRHWSDIFTLKTRKGIGHFFGAMQIDGFIDKDEFKKQIDEWIRVFRNTKPAPGTGGPLIPGDPGERSGSDPKKKGIPLLKPVVDVCWIFQNELQYRSMNDSAQGSPLDGCVTFNCGIP